MNKVYNNNFIIQRITDNEAEYEIYIESSDKTNSLYLVSYLNHKECERVKILDLIGIKNKMLN